MSDYKMMIGGKLVDAVDGKTMDVTNPANGEYVATVPCANEKDVELIVKQILLPD